MPGAAEAHECPVCGAPLDLDAQGRCIYCETPYVAPPSTPPPLMSVLESSRITNKSIALAVFLVVCVLTIVWVAAGPRFNFAFQGAGPSTPFCAVPRCIDTNQVHLDGISGSGNPSGTVVVYLNATGVDASTDQQINASEFVLTDHAGVDYHPHDQKDCQVVPTITIRGTGSGTMTLCFATGGSTSGPFRFRWSAKSGTDVALGPVF